ncbi:hypothetical protein EIP91_007811 [Steccherinum ochraceum]|uniref:Uncharacterized protein n=1 Tax=Steccherinum ochraceum TaxID=92696 RepID=A0A4R0R3U9_9APHY|nr:hypothetical protein EIP91_007811 [Steccherinum ochraceum]
MYDNNFHISVSAELAGRLHKVESLNSNPSAVEQVQVSESPSTLKLLRQLTFSSLTGIGKDWMPPSGFPPSLVELSLFWNLQFDLNYMSNCLKLLNCLKECISSLPTSHPLRNILIWRKLAIRTVSQDSALRVGYMIDGTYVSYVMHTAAVPGSLADTLVLDEEALRHVHTTPELESGMVALRELCSRKEIALHEGVYTGGHSDSSVYTYL